VDHWTLQSSHGAGSVTVGLILLRFEVPVVDPLTDFSDASEFVLLLQLESSIYRFGKLVEVSTSTLSCCTQVDS
jgi:hypothetical protein